VVITGYATLEKALQSFKTGSFDFIPKPFDTEVFLGVIRRGLNFSLSIQGKSPDQRDFRHVTDDTAPDSSEGALYCLGCHAWIRFIEDGRVLIGVGETFPRMMEGLSRLDILASENEINQGKCCAQFVTEDGLIHTFWAPLSGKIEAYNTVLDKNIRLIDSDPYVEGWIFRVIPSNFQEEAQYLMRCFRIEHDSD
jgi:glycine cleavage system H protein